MIRHDLNSIQEKELGGKKQGKKIFEKFECEGHGKNRIYGPERGIKIIYYTQNNFIKPSKTQIQQHKINCGLENII